MLMNLKPFERTFIAVETFVTYEMKLLGYITSELLTQEQEGAGSRS
jgi:hypothetical protein